MKDLQLPMSYLTRVVEHARSHGIAATALLDGTGLVASDVADPARWVELGIISTVLHRAAERLDDPGLGLELGLQTKPTTHSWYGVALITASSVREACELGIKFVSYRFSPFRAQLTVEGDTAILRFEENVALGAERLLVLEYFLGGILRMGEFLHGHSFSHPEVEFRANYSRPPYHARFAAQLPRMVYDSPTLEARHPASWLDRPLVLADADANREVVAVMAREAALDAGDIVDRLRGVLADPRNVYPDLDRAARLLGVSARTLRRQLNARGFSFRELREQARRESALLRVSRSRGSLDTIARALGYANVTAFSRAFQRWTGELPGKFRTRS